VLLAKKYIKVKNTATFLIEDFDEFKMKMLNWANQFSIFCLLDNHQYRFETPAFECLLAVGCKYSVVASAGNAFEQLKTFSNQHAGWLFGHLGYDLKNETEKLHSKNFDGINFPDAHFFVPQYVLRLNAGELTIFSEANVQEIFLAITSCSPVLPSHPGSPINIKSRINYQEYIDTVVKLQGHILRGNCYEINFCQEFFAENTTIQAVEVYRKLTAVSPMPFAALYKLHDKYAICASPERYIKKSGSKLISQPIKGTAKRNLLDGRQDENNRVQLAESEKEKAENVMVVDLVRNDLSKICRQGSVKTGELFGIYTFPQVHQMISTVSGDLENDTHWVDIVKATFPMGSMTGAPKKRVMELIEQVEKTKRGLFSGAIGYIQPGGDFDFNVVIRSILYDAATGYLSFQAGSAITFNCDAVSEYEECQLKAASIKNILAYVPGFA